MKRFVKPWEYDSVSSIWANGPRKGRGRRILPKERGYFVHVTSRTVGQAFLFGSEEKWVFIRKMRDWAEFSGLGVVTHCLMDNHFHMLLWVPRIENVGHREILRRLAEVWPAEKLGAWEKVYREVSVSKRKRMDGEMVARMGNLPEFMRVLKQSFAAWYNRTHKRRGVLWDARYRSVVVEENPLALLSVAAYVDLNPVRAGLVEDPGAYAWSGFGAASGGGQWAQRGLGGLVELARGVEGASEPKWEKTRSFYRVWLLATGSENGERERKRKGVEPAVAVAEFARWGQTPFGSALRRRRRSCTRGVAFGSEAFLRDLLVSYRGCFGPKRRRAARPIRGGWMGLHTLRQVE